MTKNPYSANGGNSNKHQSISLARLAVFASVGIFLVVSLGLHAIISSSEASLNEDTYVSQDSPRRFLSQQQKDDIDRNVEALGRKKQLKKQRKEWLLQQQQDMGDSNPGLLADGGKGGMTDDEYWKMRKAFDNDYPPSDHQRLFKFAASVRRPFSDNHFDHYYKPIRPDDMSYDPWNCPTHQIPHDYPVSWNVLDVLRNWNPDDTTPHQLIYQSLCVFYTQDDAKLYRQNELPFILRDDPQVLPTVERWNRGGTPSPYLKKLLSYRPYRADYSTNNHFMFFRVTDHSVIPPGWKEPTTTVPMTFQEWLDKLQTIETKEQLLASKQKANLSLPKITSPRQLPDDDIEHWYFRINAKNPAGKGYMYEELPFFKPNLGPTFYMVDPTQERGINCRFGPKGTLAENHYDSSRNFVIVFGGDRRYVLSHPNQCPTLALFPQRHPSGRHSAVDWAQPDLINYPQFGTSEVNEVILQAGDALYLPTQWFHFIISIDTSFQCNARSGHTSLTDHIMRDCGFLG